MLEDIRKNWGWLGVEPVEIVAMNAFGNVLFRDTTARFWRLCPEELSCTMVAGTQNEQDALLADPEFLIDWEMERLVIAARESLGAPGDGRCYCLKCPAVLGGPYAVDNLGIISVSELISFSGYLASQIADLPDGSTLRLVTE